MNRERINTVVIGGGQAGLSVGYHLQRKGVQFVILDASARVGDVWRNRWDSLRVFTPARFSSLDGMPFPADPHYDAKCWEIMTARARAGRRVLFWNVAGPARVIF